MTDLTATPTDGVASGDRRRSAAAAFARWLTTPVQPEDEPIRGELTDRLYGHRSSIAFAAVCLAMVLICYGIYVDAAIAALLFLIFLPAALARYLTIRRTRDTCPPALLLAAGLGWAAVVGLICGAGARSGDELLMLLGGLVGVAISFGGAYNSAGAPRFANIQTILFILPYCVFAGLSDVPGMAVLLIQLPLWIVGIFMLTRNMHLAHAKLIRAQHLAYHLAFHDSLTGLPNRAQFMERLADECERAARNGTNASYVFYLDLDGFKPVNDTYGHATGDDLLRAVADRFLPLVRPGDIVGRLGGDEFAAILRNVSAAQAEAIGESLIVAARQPFHLEGRPPITIGVSIGGVALGLPADMRRALHAADTMLYAAKRAGKGMLRLADAA